MEIKHSRRYEGRVQKSVLGPVRSPYLQMIGKLDMVPASFKTGSIGESYISGALQGACLSTTATVLICNSWREGIKHKYDSTLRRWVEFLPFLHDNGGWYGVIATAQSTLGNFVHVLGVPVLGNHPLPQCDEKGIPPGLHYVVIRDTNILSQLQLTTDMAVFNLGMDAQL